MSDDVSSIDFSSFAMMSRKNGGGARWLGYLIIIKDGCHCPSTASFGCCLVDSGEKECHTDSTIPIWTVLEFLFYGGVMKAVEQMASPFGDDKRDFNLNFLVDRHVKV